MKAVLIHQVPSCSERRETHERWGEGARLQGERWGARDSVPLPLKAGITFPPHVQHKIVKTAARVLISRAQSLGADTDFLRLCSEEISNSQPEHAKDLGSNSQLEHATDLGSNLQPEHAKDLGSNLQPEHATDLGSNLQPEHATDLGSNLQPEHAKDLGSNSQLEHATDLGSNLQPEHTPQIWALSHSLNTRHRSGL